MVVTRRQLVVAFCKYSDWCCDDGEAPSYLVYMVITLPEAAQFEQCFWGCPARVTNLPASMSPAAAAY